MNKFKNSILFLLLSSSFNMEALPTIINLRETSPPNYENLETVVRVKLRSDQTADSYTDYQGMELVVETRDRDTKRFAWVAKINFSGSKEGCLTSATLSEMPGTVSMQYLTHSDYYTEPRNYGNCRDFDGELIPAAPAAGSATATGVRATAAPAPAGSAATIAADSATATATATGVRATAAPAGSAATIAADSATAASAATIAVDAVSKPPRSLPPPGSMKKPFLIEKLENAFSQISKNRGGPADASRGSHYKQWIENSFFEKKLPTVYTIWDLIRFIQTLEVDNKYPRYLQYGYSSDGRCLNCVTFSMLLLEKLGVTFEGDSYIKSCISAYSERTRWGTITEYLSTAGHVGAGFWMGLKGGFLVGGVAGSIGGGVIGLGLDWGDYISSGSLFRGTLQRPVNVWYAVSTERVIKELFDKKDVLNLKIVKLIKRHATSTTSSNQTLLDTINKGEWSWYKLKDFPEDTQAVEYEIIE